MGHWGPHIVRNFSTDRRCIVRYVCDLSDSNFQRVENLIGADCAKTTQADELIQSSEVDAVVIATSASTHYQLVKQALQARKHVFCEKPLTIDWRQDKELNDLAEHFGLKLMVGYTFLFNNAVQELKKLITQDQLGQIYYLTAARTHMGLVRKDTSVVWDLATHDVAIMNYLLESAPEKVSAIGSHPLGLQKADVAFIHLFYPNKILGQIQVSWVDANKERMVRVIGSKARAVFNDLDSLEPLRLFKKGIDLDTETQPDFGEFKFLLRDGDILSPKIQQHEPLRMIIDSFIRLVLDNAENLTNGIFACSTSKTIAAAHRSMINNGVPEKVE